MELLFILVGTLLLIGGLILNEKAKITKKPKLYFWIGIGVASIGGILLMVLSILLGKRLFEEDDMAKGIWLGIVGSLLVIDCCLAGYFRKNKVLGSILLGLFLILFAVFLTLAILESNVILPKLFKAYIISL